MNVTTDSGACVGAGQCAFVAGEVFDQDEDGIVVVVQPRPVGEAAVLAQRAASLCPARAIRLDG